MDSCRINCANCGIPLPLWDGNKMRDKIDGQYICEYCLEKKVKGKFESAFKKATNKKINL